jgi:hypothetical protein
MLVIASLHTLDLNGIKIHIKSSLSRLKGYMQLIYLKTKFLLRLAVLGDGWQLEKVAREYELYATEWQIAIFY